MESSITSSAYPKISIVTPSYNQGKYLEQCICSVLEQNYPNLEYIIMDGGSSDQSVEIIQKYADRITYWVSEKDEGQSDAINRGILKATGQVVAWLNADDFYYPGALQSVAEAYLKSPDAPYFMGNGMRVNEQGETLSTIFPEGKVYFSRPAIIFGLNYVLQPATFMNRQRVVDTGLLNIHLSYVMDTDLWIRLSEKNEPATLQEVLAASREYENTKTSTGSFRRVEEIRALAEKYSGLAMTPGALCYFLDTFYRIALQHEDVYPVDYRIKLESFWSSTSQLMAQYGAHQNGTPIHPSDPISAPAPVKEPEPPKIDLSITARLKRFWQRGINKLKRMLS